MAESVDNKQADAPNLGKIRVRPARQRGHADHGWLNTYHTFSFANYYDPEFDHFHTLRVINEDRVSAGDGFGTHSHRNFEIFSYLLSGELTHRDSMGTHEVCGRGHVQFTSAGSGISHSEFNEHDTDMVHFLQIWVMPNRNGLKPGYQLKHFSDEDKYGKLRLIVSPDGEQDSVKINQDVKVYATLLKNGEEISYQTAPGRSIYVHLAQDVTGMRSEANQVGVMINGVPLAGGDGAFVTNENKHFPMTINLQGHSRSDDVRAEMVVFDIANIQ
eukprot:TRINITY_DN658_c0_g1_i1.p2 TRINITY_DN658_c0_g1~~TRINITY_DN658_c0_g1_i1.p2  ORF type:complete len:273 (+),score=92.26 TRINITY_DN658_c0_g1_i1:113-931(+)